MKIKPILFNTEMVKAILAGRKLQTRRIVKYSHGEVFDLASWFDYNKNSDREPLCFWFDVIGKFGSTYDCIEPYARAGDILYVRETWNYGYVETSDAEYSHEVWFEEIDYKERGNESFIDYISHFYYKADDEGSDIGMTWRPSIHMPKEAARIFLKVTKVHVEKLQDISEYEAQLEGVRYTDFGMYTPSWKASIDGGQTFHASRPIHYSGYHVKDVTNPEQCYPTAKSAFANLWNSTLKKSVRDKYGFEANPLVWVYTFERCEKPEDF